MKYARIIQLLAERLKITDDEAIDVVYNSPELIDTGIADMHCRSDHYLAEEIINELKDGWTRIE